MCSQIGSEASCGAKASLSCPLVSPGASPVCACSCKSSSALAIRGRDGLSSRARQRSQHPFLFRHEVEGCRVHTHNPIRKTHPRRKPLLQFCRQLRALRLREVPVRIAHTPSSVFASRARLPTSPHRGAATVAAPAFRAHGAATVAPTGCVYESSCTLRRLKRVAQTVRRVLRDRSLCLVPYHRRLPGNVQFKSFRPVIGVVT